MQVKLITMILFIFTIIKKINKIALNNNPKNDNIKFMKKFCYFLLIPSLTTGAYATENPFFNGYKNQIALDFGWGVDSGFLIPAPIRWVPFIMGQFQYSQPSEFFRLPARKSLNIVQTLGAGTSRGWHWDKYTIPIVTISQDVILAYNNNWYFFTGLSAGFQAQQNERIGSKLLFGFKFGGGYRLSDCVSIELFAQHYSNGNTAPENNSYAFFGTGFTFNF